MEDDTGPAPLTGPRILHTLSGNEARGARLARNMLSPEQNSRSAPDDRAVAPIVVTGVGACSAAGPDASALWRALLAGRSLAVWREYTWSGGAQRAAVCAAGPLDPERLPYRPARKMDRSVHLALWAATEAWQSAGFSATDDPGDRLAIIAGTSRGPVGAWTFAQQAIHRPRVPPSLASQTGVGGLSGALAQYFRAGGPSYTVSAACASSALALIQAAHLLRLGEADVVLAGGAEAPLEAGVLAQFAAAGLLGHQADAAQVCRPFDRHRNGLVLGEGAAFLVLETADHARRRGAIVWGTLAGWAAGTDHAGRCGVQATGDALERILVEALRRGRLRPADLDYVNAHGTATRLNDRAEAAALGRVLGGETRRIPCGATKPVTGHCLGASAALEAVICLQVLRHQIIPPAVNCPHPDPACPVTLAPSAARATRVRAALSTSLGFWGAHAGLLFRAETTALAD